MVSDQAHYKYTQHRPEFTSVSPKRVDKNYLLPRIDDGERPQGTKLAMTTVRVAALLKVTIVVQRKHKTSRRLGNSCRKQTCIESIRRASVKEALKWFEALRLNISEITGATIRHLMNEKWVKNAASPGEISYRDRISDKEAQRVITAAVEEIHQQQALLIGSMMTNFHLYTSCHDM